MSIKSTICIINDDNTVDGIYCHCIFSDTGKILLTYYNNENNIRELIRFGDIIALKDNVEKNITLNYADKIHEDNYVEFLKYHKMEYNYFYIPKYGWLVLVDDFVYDLSSMLNMEKQNA